MTQCKAEFFDKNLHIVHHSIINLPNIDDDYLAPEASTIEIFNAKSLPNARFIYISGDWDFFGVITDIQYEDYGVKVKFKPFINIFDTDILFDTNDQMNKSLESSIYDIINRYFIDSNDIEQNISVLNINKITETSEWGLNIKSDVENMHHSIINFYNVLLKRSMSKYGVALYVIPDFVNRKIIIDIGSKLEPIKIDCSDINIVVDTFKINQASDTINKLEVWNDTNYNQVVYFYLHPDGKFDTENINRVTPVVLDVKSVHPSRPGTQKENGEEWTEEELNEEFSQLAVSEAFSTLGNISWTNYIELEVSPNSKLYKKITIGQTAIIYRNGEEYQSILTGKKISNVAKLVFGTVRVDFTKKMLGGA